MKQETATEPQEIEQQNQLTEYQSDKANSLALITNDENMERVMRLAKLMASSKATVPKHLQGNEGDCAAVILQSMNWGMNPFAVGQKTHLVGGTLGYEAQLVNAVIMANSHITGRFHYEYRGTGKDLECRVGAIIKGETEINWGSWLRNGDVTTRNSPLWVANPQQQLGYLQVKNWARQFCPGAILGVYTPDELQEMPDKEINPRPQGGAATAQAAREKGNVIDPAQEERRTAMIAELDAAAKEGKEKFNVEWKRIGAKREDRLLIGEAEYIRMMTIAIDAQQETA